MAHTFHPDLRAARFFPRTVFAGPRSVHLVRTLSSLGSSANGSGPRVLLFRPEGDASGLPALLWLHGGGLTVGTARQDAAYCRRVADELGIVVASVDYRLAPEHPFPAPLEDAYTALRWLAARPEVDAGRIAVGGASAGGGLAAALALLAAERGEIRPVFQLLVYPMLDDRTTLRTDVDEAALRIWSPKANRYGWQSYLGDAIGTDAVPPLAAPARYADLSGAPPAWIGVGSLDLFHDEDVAYAQRLRDAGVACELTIVPGAYHGFYDLQRTARVSLRFVEEQIAALAGGLGVRA